MEKRLSWVVALCCLGANAAWAEPGESLSGEGDALRIVAPSGAPCAPRGGLCILPGADTTVSSGSSPVAGAPQPSPVVRLARAAQDPGGDAPWQLRIEAALKRPALAGNALFLVYDLADPAAIASHTVTALFQAPIPAGRALAARLRLSPVDGIAPGHTYRIRVVQLLGGRELLLAEGDVTLL